MFVFNQWADYKVYHNPIFNNDAFQKTLLITLISILWLGLGVINFVLLGFRTTPLTAIDFYVLTSVLGIIDVYVNKLQIILILVIIAIIIVALIILWKRLPKNQAQFKRPLTLLGITATLIFLMSIISFKVKAVSHDFSNLADAYSDYGFAYCFSISLFDRGINEPDAYSEESIEAVLETISRETKDNTSNGKESDNSGESTELKTNNIEDVSISELQPNIIMVQLESFFDVNQLLDFTFSQDPIPNFTQIKKAYSYGYLTVPSIGAGTANTEFEIITGMNIKYFGAGEYPYKTILQTTTCESIPYNLDALSYHSHAIHNNTGTFYDRNKVFQKLGFDSYSSIEYMNNIEYNPLGWAKDYILTTEIIKALDARYTRDFIYAISVQPHGKYPDKIIDESQRIKVYVDPKKRKAEKYDGDRFHVEKGNTQESKSKENDTEKDLEDNEIEKIDLGKSNKNKFEYYVNQLYETDEFIGELIAELSIYDEPTVVVFFGDHLPAMSLKNEDLVNNNKFQTEYILWSNFKMKQVNRDLNAYQLTAYIMERLGYDNGILTKFHQKYVEQPDYQEELEMLQYDMLYGDRNVFEGENPYIEKTIQMGIYKIEITNVTEKGEVLFIEGDHFTPWSVVYIDEEPKEPLFIDENTLIVPHEKISNERIYVAQVNNNDIILSQSKEWNSI